MSKWRRDVPVAAAPLPKLNVVGAAVPDAAPKLNVEGAVVLAGLLASPALLPNEKT